MNIETDELRQMESTELKERMNDLKKEMIEERGQIEVGGFAENPGRISDIKKNIAKIKTELNQRNDT
jgi:large subunit ribosomal protein L29